MVRRRQHDEEAGSSSGGSRKRTRASRVKAEETPNQEVLERGKLFFFYRPKVGVDEVASEADIQRTYIEMAPEGEHHMIRLLLMPRKHLPHPRSGTTGRSDVCWAFVDRLASTQEQLNAMLQEQTYQTKTLGQRTVHACRCVGEADYTLELTPGNGHVHLYYVLREPTEPGEVQDDLNIEREGAFVLQIKNPERSAPEATSRSERYPEGFRGLDEHHHAQYSEKLREEFHSKVKNHQDLKFVAGRELPKMLDVLHTELLLIAANKPTSRQSWPSPPLSLKESIKKYKRPLSKSSAGKSFFI